MMRRERESRLLNYQLSTPPYFEEPLDRRAQLFFLAPGCRVLRASLSHFFSLFLQFPKQEIITSSCLSFQSKNFKYLKLFFPPNYRIVSQRLRKSWQHLANNNYMLGKWLLINKRSSVGFEPSRQTPARVLSPLYTGWCFRDAYTPLNKWQVAFGCCCCCSVDTSTPSPEV